MKFTYIVQFESDIERPEDLAGPLKVMVEDNFDVDADVKIVLTDASEDESYTTIGFLQKVVVNVPKDGIYETTDYSDACKEVFENADTMEQEAMKEVDDLQVDLIAEL